MPAQTNKCPFARNVLLDTAPNAIIRTMDNYTDQLKQFVENCRAAGRSGLVKCSSGNLSQRISGGRALLSATRSWLEKITSDQVAVCDITDASVVNDVKPTVESGFHLGILRQRPEVNVVFHFQSPFATVLACDDTSNIEFNVLPEVPFYLGTVASVPFMLPGSDDLASAVIESAKTSDMIILKNHGQVTFGVDFDEAIQKAHFFELACRVLVSARSPVTITPENVKHIQWGYKKER